MSLFLDIGQGAGLAGAAGVRPYLPPLLAGALAKADAGIDFDGTSYEFLESPGFLAGVLALAVVSYFIERRRTGADPRLAGAAQRRAEIEGRAPWLTAADGLLVAAALAFGALMFAGSLESGGRDGALGLPAGGVCAALGYLAVAGILTGARRRLARAGSAALVDAYADAVALAVTALAIFADPTGYVLLLAFVLLIARSRRAGERKYAGLRVLR